MINFVLSYWILNLPHNIHRENIKASQSLKKCFSSSPNLRNMLYCKLLRSPGSIPWNRFRHASYVACRARARIFKRLWSPGIDPRKEFRQPMCLAGRYDNPIPTRFLAPLDCLKLPAQYDSPIPTWTVCSLYSICTCLVVVIIRIHFITCFLSEYSSCCRPFDPLIRISSQE
jgi:hypothetical protein